MKCLRFILPVLVFLLAAPALRAQRNDFVPNRPYADQKRMHLGFSVGMHFQDLKFTHNGYVTPDGQSWWSEIPSYSPGFNVTVLGDLRLHKHFNLRISPGMFFGNKTVTFRESVSGIEERQDVKTAYVVLPIDLKISGDRWLNSRPYVTLGVMGTLDVSKNAATTFSSTQWTRS